MDRSYPYTRRVIQRARLRQRAAVLAAAGVAGCAVLYAVLQPSFRYEAPAAIAAPVMLAMAPAAPAPAQAARRVYPYSVVPGGVSGQSELARVIRTDKVVAAHYASFDVDKAEEKVVTTPRAVHVSYRKGDQVFWTTKKLMLAQGETLLSDGTHEARARCANRISDTPRFPVEANEPTAEELDSSTVEDGPGATGSQPAFAMAGSDDAIGPRSVRLPGGSGGAGPRSMGGGASSDASRTLSSAAHTAALDPVRWGGSLSGTASSASSSTGSRPAPGASTDLRDVDAPGADSGAAGGETHTNIGSTNPPALQDSSLPALPSTASEPAVSLPQLVVRPDATPPATTPGSGSPGTFPILPGGLSGGGDSNGDEPALPSLPVSGGGIELPPSKDPGDSPVPEPSLTQPVLPAPAREDAKPGQVPEPGSLWLAGAALAAMLGQRRRTSRKTR